MPRLSSLVCLFAVLTMLAGCVTSPEVRSGRKLEQHDEHASSALSFALARADGALDDRALIEELRVMEGKIGRPDFCREVERARSDAEVQAEAADRGGRSAAATRYRGAAEALVQVMRRMCQ